MANKLSAPEVIKSCGIKPGTDFYTLSSFQVGQLLEFADIMKYRKPKNANGSRGRYFYAYLQRKARKEA